MSMCHSLAIRGRVGAWMVLFFLAGFTQETGALEVGRPAPSFSIALADGHAFVPAQARGEVIILNLWATWCPICRAELPALDAYYRRHSSEGLRLIAVDMDTANNDAEVRALMAPYAYPLGIGRLSDLAGLGRIWRLPMTFVIDRLGVLRRDGSGPRVDQDTLEREVTPLLRERPRDDTQKAKRAPKDAV